MPDEDASPETKLSPEALGSLGKAETDSESEGNASAPFRSKKPDHTAAAGIKNAMFKPKNAIRNLVRIFLTPFWNILCGSLDGYAKKIPGSGFSLPGIKIGIRAVF